MCCAPVTIVTNGSPDGGAGQPVGRWLHTASAFGNNMYVFGGVTRDYVPLNDLWVFDTFKKSWSQPVIAGQGSDFPFPRMLHSAALLGDDKNKDKNGAHAAETSRRLLRCSFALFLLPPLYQLFTSCVCLQPKIICG